MFHQCKTTHSCTKSNWGGVGLYVVHHLQYTKREELSFTTIDSENLFIEVNVKGKTSIKRFSESRFINNKKRD